MKTEVVLLLLLLLSACYGSHHRTEACGCDTCEVSEAVVPMECDSASCDSAAGAAGLYAEGFNFVVTADSLCIQPDEPLLATGSPSTLVLHRDDELVVVMRETLADDSARTVWVRVARDQYTMGWVREDSLLLATVPDDPISLFIHTFSDVHLIWFLSTVAIVSLLLLVRWRMRRSTRMVHFHDIPSPYPTLLCVGMATSAVLYACIQHFVPAVWQHFYFYPTLNPFGLQPLLCAFLSMLWLELLLALATLDEVLHLLPASQAVLYLLSTLAFSMGVYTIFSLVPLLWVAMPGLMVYAVWAVVRYYRHARPTCLCGHCGRPMHHSSGRCPWCGANNS